MKDPFAVERAVAQTKIKAEKKQSDEFLDTFGKPLIKALKGDLEPLIKANKGEPGKTPVKGTDYFTDAEIEAIKKDVLAQIPTPENGKDAEVNYDLVFAYVIEQVSKIPKPKDGEPGKDAVVDTAQIVADVLKQIPKTEKLTVDYSKIQELIDEKVKTIPWNEKRVVGYSSLKQLTDVVLDGVPQDSKGNYILTPGGGGGGHTIEDEGTPLTQRTNLNFVGAGVTVTDDAGNDATVVTIPGGGSGTVNTIVAGNNIDVDATDPANPIVSVETLTLADISDVTASVTEVNYIDGVTSAIQTQLNNKEPLKGADDNYVTDAEKAALHAAVTVTDSNSVDFTLTGQQITASVRRQDTAEIALGSDVNGIFASLIAGSIDETKLDASVNASLDLADSAIQLAGLTNYFNKSVDDTDDITEGATNKFVTAAEKTKLGFISVTQAVDLDAIETNANNVPGIKTKTDFIAVTQNVDLDTIETNSNASKVKTDFITVTQSVDLDTIESDTATNNAKVTNATHNGEVTGSGALTVDKTAITNKTLVTAAVGDSILISDASDTDNLKKVTVQSIVDLAGGGGTNFNTIYIDQAGGTSDTYGVLAGTRNGSNAVFTVSQGEYATGTLKIWRNGQLMTQGSSEDFVETTPASGTFTLAVAPAANDELTVEYQLVAASGTSFVAKTGDTMTGDLVVPDEAYDQTNWNGNNEVPTKNAVRDMRENLFGVTVAIYQGFSGI